MHEKARPAKIEGQSGELTLSQRTLLEEDKNSGLHGCALALGGRTQTGTFNKKIETGQRRQDPTPRGGKGHQRRLKRLENPGKEKESHT